MEGLEGIGSRLMGRGPRGTEPSSPNGPGTNPTLSRSGDLPADLSRLLVPGHSLYLSPLSVCVSFWAVRRGLLPVRGLERKGCVEFATGDRGGGRKGHPAACALVISGFIKTSEASRGGNAGDLRSWARPGPWLRGTLGGAVLLFQEKSSPCEGQWVVSICTCPGKLWAMGFQGQVQGQGCWVRDLNAHRHKNRHHTRTPRRVHSPHTHPAHYTYESHTRCTYVLIHTSHVPTYSLDTQTQHMHRDMDVRVHACSHGYIWKGRLIFACHTLNSRRRTMHRHTDTIHTHAEPPRTPRGTGCKASPFSPLPARPPAFAGPTAQRAGFSIQLLQLPHWRGLTQEPLLTYHLHVPGCSALGYSSF